jgi:hypothetical protein
MGTLGVARLITSVLPHLTGLRVPEVTMAEGAILVAVKPVRKLACCPLCHQRSRRVRAHFIRLLAAVPWNGHAGTAYSAQSRLLRARRPTAANPGRVWPEPSICQRVA